MKPTEKDIETAVAQLTVLEYFPSEPIARAVVMNLLARMVGTTEQLNWLVRTMIDRFGKWRGPTELRGVFCNKFRPADGIEADSSVRGFAPEDSEGAYLMEVPVKRYLPAPDDEPIPTRLRRQIDETVARKRLKG